MTQLPSSIPDVADVRVLRGARAPLDRAPRLLIEMPHGATRTHHYATWRARMRGVLPDGLEDFFHVNTDVGSWALGLAVGEALVASRPELSVLLVRSLIPRTLIDVNRVVERTATDLTAGGLTAALPPYVRDARDVRLLLDAHRRYTTLVEQCWETVMATGGLALIPHTYGPVSLGIPQVDDNIVPALRAAHEPATYATWPVRAEVDLITRDGSGVCLAPEGSEAALVAAYAQEGLTAELNHTYFLHPSAMGSVWSARWPGRALCVEVRRDLLVRDWTWNREMTPLPAAVARAARPLISVLSPRI